MQRLVGSLVEARLKNLQTTASKQESSQLDAYVHEMELLQKQWAEAQRGYEHQIDLLLSSSAKSKATVEEMMHELKEKVDQEHKLNLALEETEKQFRRLQEETELLEGQFQETLRQKESLLSEYQKTMSEQRMVIEKKQRYIGKLEAKVRDLMYEIRSLLQLEEPPASPLLTSPLIEVMDGGNEKRSAPFLSPSQEVSSYDLSLQLQRYLQLAQNFTGADHFGTGSGKSARYLDLSFESYAIDLRRLFDRLRDETTGIIFVYSQTEGRFLFINNLVKNYLGWSADKFMKDFPQLIEAGYPDWSQALARLPASRESQLRLVLRSKSGEEILFQCFMGIVSQGPFLNHVIGILSPSSSTYS